MTAHPSEDREATERNSATPSPGDVRDYTASIPDYSAGDGETRWISVKSTDRARRVSGKAITPDRRAHRCHRTGGGGSSALRQSEERFRKLADQLAELNATLAQRVERKTGSATGSGTCRRTSWWSPTATASGEPINPAWTRTLGWSEAELLNRTSEWLEHPDDGGHDPERRSAS